MADISMCSDSKCPLKNDCYRFRAIPSEFRQAYAGFTYDQEIKNCENYWSIGKREDLTPIKKEEDE